MSVSLVSSLSERDGSVLALCRKSPLPTERQMTSERKGKTINKKTPSLPLLLSPLTEVNVFLFFLLGAAVSLIDDLSSFSVNFLHEESVTS